MLPIYWPKLILVCAVRSPNRPPPFLGGPSGTCRSKSYHHNGHSPDNIHAEPLCRRTVRATHPIEHAGIIPAQSYGGRRSHATRYVIVNEHEPRKKLLRSATRIPRHYLLEEPAEILELYPPRNMKRYTHRSAHHQSHHPHRAHLSQQHLSEDEEDGKGGRGHGRMSSAKALRPHSLSDLHQPAHFYIGEQGESHSSRADNSNAGQQTCGAQEDVEEEDGEGDMESASRELTSRSKSSVRVTDPVVVRIRHHIHPPGQRCQSPARTRHMESYVKTKTRVKLETPLTESDSASLASSSDQQNSSTDQYIQVIHNKERYFKSDARQQNMAKRKSKTGFDGNESNDLVCSNV